MKRYIDISALADEVLASVETSASEKTAADATPEMHSELGRALKLAAHSLRSPEPVTVTAEDIESLLVGARKYASNGRTVSLNTRAVDPRMGKLGSVAGDELRKIANVLRERSIQEDEQRAVKAAHMITAATGLAHLTRS